ncbi:hypothetical protein [Streptomyces sp. NBC_01198]|uniref:hypothetical protein n=1 Tax=Streptomyces sp. NBC_01198 TaxID=2903769 RepID=UPI002E158A41|nr:hypothetical protein OG702_00770 [Streptomyces sp. NBC_01198]
MYDTLAAVALDPPKYPYPSETRKLVLRGSVVEKLCECGNGQVVCSRCGGRGDLDCAATAPCATCHGINPCARCHGTGRAKGGTSTDIATPTDERVNCRKCGTAKTACSGCHGQGQVPCPTCEGKGRRACPACHSEGTVVHKSCGGTGGSVSWTEGVITRTRRNEAIRLPATGPARLARWRAGETGQWRETTLAHHDPLPSDLAAQFATLRTRLAEQTDEIARRATLRYLPLARVQVHQQAHRIYYVYPRDDTLQVRTLPSRHRGGQIAAGVLGGLALLILLLVLL